MYSIHSINSYIGIEKDIKINSDGSLSGIDLRLISASGWFINHWAIAPPFLVNQSELF